MKTRNYKIVKVLNISILFLVSLFANIDQIETQNNIPKKSVLSCSNFAAAINETILFGNSEDGNFGHYLREDPLSSQMFYFPAGADGHGCTFVGWLVEDYIRSVQGGMNDQGLCYDLTGIPEAPMISHPEKPYRIDGTWIQYDVLRENANVSEAIDFLQNVNWEGPIWFQWFFADSTGDMVIVSPGPDGELAFTRKVAGVDGFLTQTNFNRITNESESGGFNWQRYETSTEMLTEIRNEENLNVTAFNSILEAIHFKKRLGFTGYSNVFDPRNQMAYITFLSQFDETAVINVTEELSIPGYRAIPMTDYFSQETIDAGLSYFKDYKRRTAFVFVGLPVIGTILLISGIVVASFYIIRKRKKAVDKIN
ncbi:MAG: hypothetical protein HZR80_18940 [Candidatus Heimdallarchaeota archaeon]